MIARGKGVIVNIASALALHGYPGAAVYSGTKSYLLTFARAVQGELAGTGVGIQTVLPASVATELYESAGMSLSDIPAELVMSANDMVTAALNGLDRGEEITLPSVQDTAMWGEYEAGREALFFATQTGSMASRYREAEFAE
jgi:short-subunit dehydrogenase